MISNIVLATDGSTHAINAMKLAIDLTKKYSATLTIVHVLTHDHPSGEMTRMLEIEHQDDPTPDQKTESAETFKGTYKAVGRFLRGGIDAKEIRVITVLGEQILEKAAQTAKKAGIKNVKTIIRDGDYANNILDIAEDVNADMIVMGRRGLSNLKGFVTGSVSHKVSQRSKCSVLTAK